MGLCRRMISNVWRLVIRTMLPLAINAILFRCRTITGSMLAQVAAESTLLQKLSETFRRSGADAGSLECFWGGRSELAGKDGTASPAGDIILATLAAGAFAVAVPKPEAAEFISSEPSGRDVSMAFPPR